MAPFNRNGGLTDVNGTLSYRGGRTRFSVKLELKHDL